MFIPGFISPLRFWPFRTDPLYGSILPVTLYNTQLIAIVARQKGQTNDATGIGFAIRDPGVTVHTGWPFIHCCVFLVSWKKRFSQCTLLYTRTLKKWLLTRYQHSTVMFIWLPCIWAFEVSLIDIITIRWLIPNCNSDFE